MTHLFPPSPPVGTPMPASHDSAATRDLLALRRSAGKQTLVAPGPDANELDRILAIAMRVPDHRRLSPWRFIVFEGEARDAFNAAAVEIQRVEDPDATESMLAETGAYMHRAPVVIAVISSPDPGHKTPIWEQYMSAGAVCFNLLLTANASDWAGCWLSEWIAYSPGINRLLGLNEHEQVAGYIYLGTAAEPPQERMRPDPPTLISRWSPPG